MSSSHSTMMARPSLGHRSISELAPLHDPATHPHSGSRLRGSKAASGAQIPTGSVLPFSPLLPLPPASESKTQYLHPSHADPEQSENLAPSAFPGHHRGPVGPSALASRRQARRGVSEGYAFHSHQPKARGIAMAPSASSTLGPKTALRLDIAAASDISQASGSKSAGMIRSYSMPVATQEEHDEQQRIMALGLSPVGHYAANPAWWQYGWPSPGGVNHRHLQRPSGAAPEFVGERRRSSQSKLSTVMTPAMVAAASASASGPSPMSQSPATSRPSSRASKTHSSCSPKMKNKHLPSIHQHTFQNASSRSASSSPKMGRSPLSMISVNLPANDQQQHEQALKTEDNNKMSANNEAFDIEMDALNQRFEQWSRSQTLSTLRESNSHQDLASTAATEDEDYFNLRHDEPEESPVRGSNAGAGFFLRAAGNGSDTSDEARTPRASSPRPLSKAALHYQDHHSDTTKVADSEHSYIATDRWSGNFDFIHPDHL